jgi:hypothetical protein
MGSVDVEACAALVGEHVTLWGLKRFECNGLNGVVVSWDAEARRAGVKIDGRGDILAVHPENLQLSTALHGSAQSCTEGVQTSTVSASDAGGAGSSEGASASSAPPPQGRHSSARQAGPLRIQQSETSPTQLQRSIPTRAGPSPAGRRGCASPRHLCSRCPIDSHALTYSPMPALAVRGDPEHSEELEDIEDMCEGADKAAVKLLHRVRVRPTRALATRR